jgi:hypothetical protein
MSRAGSLVWAIGVIVLAGASSRLPAQTPGAGVEPQVRSQYRLTRIGSNGVLVGQAGSLLTIQEDGLAAIPAAFGKYWYNTYKKGGRIKVNAIQHLGNAFQDAMAARRPFQVGEKMYLTNLEFTPTEVIFYVQSCGACDPAAIDPNDPPYRARLAFQFDKGFLSAADSRQVLETTGRVFGVDRPAAQAPQPPAIIPAPAPGPGVLQNQDVVKMTKAGFDDSIIIAKIEGSQCKFDTSPDALLQLKQGGVTPAVLKAMVSAK